MRGPRPKSEIDFLVFEENNEVVAVLDVDSDEYDSFDEKNRKWLERIVKPFSEKLDESLFHSRNGR
ncbi:hypothetical protein H5T51_04865 [Candidatus Bathyarchaeota archaeon]|nr:hypothetical protein [Candidatus Bathyarchaeota archaeon]